MNYFLTRFVNAESHKKYGILFLAVSLIFVFSNVLQAAEIRSLRFLQLPQTMQNFKFDQFQSLWISSKEEWKIFWKTYSRNSGEAPELTLNWQNESVLALFWPSQKEALRTPSFIGSEVFKSGDRKKIRLQFNLTTSCLDTPTEVSPAEFVVVDSSFEDLDSISIKTLQSRSMGCY